MCWIRNPYRLLSVGRHVGWLTETSGLLPPPLEGSVRRSRPAYASRLVSGPVRMGSTPSHPTFDGSRPPDRFLSRFFLSIFSTGGPAGGLLIFLQEVSHD